MKGFEELVLIYGEKGINRIDNTFSSSKFIYAVFSDLGLIDREYIEKAYHETFLIEGISSESQIGPFESLDELRKFSQNLLDLVDGNVISFLDKTTYNSTVEELNEVSDFFPALFNKGEQINNHSSKKRSLLNKFFK